MLYPSIVSDKSQLGLKKNKNKNKIVLPSQA